MFSVKFIQTIFVSKNLNKCKIKHQLYPKSVKINAFEQKFCHNPGPHTESMHLYVVRYKLIAIQGTC